MVAKVGLFFTFAASFSQGFATMAWKLKESEKTAALEAASEDLREDL